VKNKTVPSSSTLRSAATVSESGKRYNAFEGRIAWPKAWTVKRKRRSPRRRSKQASTSTKSTGIRGSWGLGFAQLP
jgi:hypothetical protein